MSPAYSRHSGVNEYVNMNENECLKWYYAQSIHH